MATTQPILHLDDTLGAIVIGAFIAIFLFGVSTVQVYIYYGLYPRDSLFIKSLVSFIWVIELAHTICICQSTYLQTVTNFGQVEKLLVFPLSLYLIIGFSAIVTFAVQCFFINRVRLFISSIYLTSFLWILCTVRLCGNLFLVGESVKSENRNVPSIIYLHTWGWLFTVLFASAAFVDVTITVVLVWNLFKKRQAVFFGTVKLVDKLIWWTIQTGLATSLTVVSTTILFNVMEWNLIWGAVYMCLGKVYFNSLMVLLNSRRQLRNTGIVYENSRVVDNCEATIGEVIRFRTMAETASNTEGTLKYGSTIEHATAADASEKV